MKAENAEKLAAIVERLDNLKHALMMPLPDNIHVMGVKPAIPEMHQELKDLYIDEVGENPWEY